MTEEEWQRLYENFETTWLLSAVDDIDKLRSYLGDRANLEPPQIRDDLLELHGFAMEVVNNGSEDDLEEMADLAYGLEDQISELMDVLTKVQKVIRKLIELLPEAEDGFDDDLLG